MSTEHRMPGHDSDDLAALIRGDRVHRRVYTDPGLFALEMERIFGRAWIYVGHESQVRNPGDFATTRIGRQPVIMVRHEDGAIHVLNNRCAHRAAMVATTESGHVEAFRCAYHGWTYRTDGRLSAVPIAQGYPGNLDLDDPANGLMPVARSAAYRGFVFASLAAEGPGLVEFLGPMTSSFDDMVDRAPGDELEVAGGVFKHAFDANWKVYLENLCDGVHPANVHESSIDAARGQDDGVHSDGAGEIALRQMRQNGVGYHFFRDGVGMWTTPHGHSFMGDYHDDEKLVAALDDPAFADYLAALKADKGEARAREILAVARWNSNVWPNLSFMSRFRQLRVVHPVAVDRTEVHTYSFRMPKAPPAMFEDTIRFANVTNGTGSPVLTDDLETYGRIGEGLRCAQAEWVHMGREYQTDGAAGDGLRETNGTSELHIRNMFAAWLDHMARA